ncbi:MAG: hypothetical protein ACTJHW_15765 [Paenalcaligenes sp.]
MSNEDTKKLQQKNIVLAEEIIAINLAVSSIAAALVRQGILTHEEMSQMAYLYAKSKALANTLPGLEGKLDEIFQLAKEFEENMSNYNSED